MKQLVTIILALSFVFLGLIAGNKPNRMFRILYLNPTDITINGKTIGTDSVFVLSEASRIIWASEKQVMKVVDVKTGEQYIMTAKQYKEEGDKAQFFFYSKRLGTRAGNVTTLEDLSLLFRGPVIIETKESIPCELSQDANHFFYLSLYFEDEIINKKITPHNSYLVISVKELFTIDGKTIPLQPIKASLYYYDDVKESSICVSEGFELIPIL